MILPNSLPSLGSSRLHISLNLHCINAGSRNNYQMPISCQFLALISTWLNWAAKLIDFFWDIWKHQTTQILSWLVSTFNLIPKRFVENDLDAAGIKPRSLASFPPQVTALSITPRPLRHRMQNWHTAHSQKSLVNMSHGWHILMNWFLLVQLS